MFHRLNTFKKQSGKGKIFAVLGCVAQQEGEKIFDRAPHVSLVAGSASYAKLPEMLVQLEAGNKRVTGLTFDDEEAFETPFTKPRQSASRLHHHHRRLRQKLRVLRGSVHARSGAQPHQRERDGRSARLGRHTATPKFNCSARTSTVIAIRRPPVGISPTLLARVGEIPGIRRVRFTTSHPRDFVKPHHRRDRGQPGALQPRASAGAVGLHARALRHAAPIHARRIHAPHRVDEERPAHDRHHHRHHHRLSRARRSGSSRRRWICSTKCSTRRCSFSSTRRARTPPRRSMTNAIPEEEKTRRFMIAAGAAARHPDPPQFRTARDRRRSACGRPPCVARAVDRAHLAEPAR